MTASLGPRQTALLEAWGDRIAESAAGNGFDLSDRNHTFRLQRRLADFLEDPTEETFREAWNRETLRDAVVGGPGLVLRNWDSPDDIAAFVETVAAADEYDPAWETEFVNRTVVWELYGRLHPETSPILNSQANAALRSFGYDGIHAFEDGVERWRSFRDDYETVVGHASGGTDHEVPINVEIEALLALVHMLDDRELHDTLAGRAEYRPLVGWERDVEDARVVLSGLDLLVDAYVEGRRERAYRDEQTDYWGGNHWETWKQGFRDDFTEYVQSTDDLTALDPEHLVPIFDRLDGASDLSSSVPAYLLGGRSGGIAWGQFKELSNENPEEAAAVLSTLFDEDEFLPSRLERFRHFYDDIDTSGGPMLSLATLLLMFAYPRRYVMYRYSEFHDFFEAFSDYDVTTGFDTDQYFYLNESCSRILDRLDEHLGDATMLDVHSLIWIWNEQGHPDR